MSKKLLVFMSRFDLDGEAMTQTEILRTVSNALDDEGMRPKYEFVDGKMVLPSIVVNGAFSPREIFLAAEGWNEKIRQRAIQAAQKWLANPTLDSTESYVAKAALASADNSFGYSSDEAVLSQYSIFDGEIRLRLGTLFTDEYLEAVREKPENYAIVELMVEREND